jgi:hypothetical protein
MSLGKDLTHMEMYARQVWTRQEMINRTHGACNKMEQTGEEL